MNRTVLTRRAALLGAGATAVALLTGCNLTSDDDNDDDDLSSSKKKSKKKSK